MKVRCIDDRRRAVGGAGPGTRVIVHVAGRARRASRLTVEVVLHDEVGGSDARPDDEIVLGGDGFEPLEAPYVATAIEPTWRPDDRRPPRTIRLRAAGLLAVVVVLGVVLLRPPGHRPTAPIVPASEPLVVTAVVRTTAPRTCPVSFPLDATVDITDILEHCRPTVPRP